MTQSRVRCFFIAFILSVTLLSLGPTFLLIECNQQRTLYGQVDLGVNFTLEEGLPTLTTDRGDATPDKTITGTLIALLAPAEQVVFGLLRWQADAAAGLWEAVLPG